MTFEELKRNIINQNKLLDIFNQNSKSLEIYTDTVNIEMYGGIYTDFDLPYVKVSYIIHPKRGKRQRVVVGICAKTTFVDVLNNIYEQLLFARDKYMPCSSVYAYYDKVIMTIKKSCKKLADHIEEMFRFPLKDQDLTNQINAYYDEHKEGTP